MRRYVWISFEVVENQARDKARALATSQSDSFVESREQKNDRLERAAFMKKAWAIKAASAWVWAVTLLLHVIFALAVIILFVIVLATAIVVEPYRPLAVFFFGWSAFCYIRHFVLKTLKFRSEFKRKVEQKHLAHVHSQMEREFTAKREHYIAQMQREMLVCAPEGRPALQQIMDAQLAKYPHSSSG